jgi:hypothetical protein
MSGTGYMMYSRQHCKKSNVVMQGLNELRGVIIHPETVWKWMDFQA